MLVKDIRTDGFSTILRLQIFEVGIVDFEQLVFMMLIVVRYAFLCWLLNRGAE